MINATAEEAERKKEELNKKIGTGFSLPLFINAVHVCLQFINRGIRGRPKEVF
jgi:hypothetical protein